MWPFKRRTKPKPDAEIMGFEVVDLRSDKTPPLSDVTIMVGDEYCSPVDLIVMSFCMATGRAVLANINKWNQIEISQ